ncbi:hypothetical protein [Desulfurivibrio dismutans]|uniref:hypothetical protein n=1 Tax=Desulfurivibrio dismutans TaxID=1398908 RepID=UPI0023DB985D|nr:hypothetical protein [Desulfurivibrio alkaliphilus]MDF1614024.1 hypothetical protein [Desulfurivibrio alkaliphilus]
MIVDIIDKLRRHLPLLAKFGLALLVVLLLWDIFLLDKSKAYTAVESLPGFWSFFGFAAAVLIIVVAKTIGLIGLQTDEDYYDK